MWVTGQHRSGGLSCAATDCRVALLRGMMCALRCNKAYLQTTLKPRWVSATECYWVLLSCRRGHEAFVRLAHAGHTSNGQMHAECVHSPAGKL